MSPELLIYIQIGVIIVLLLIIFRSPQHHGQQYQDASLAFEYLGNAQISSHSEYMGPIRAGSGPIEAGYGAVEPEVEQVPGGMCTEAGGRIIPCADL